MREVHPKLAAEENRESSRVSRTGYEELKQLCTFFFGQNHVVKIIDHHSTSRQTMQQVICDFTQQEARPTELVHFLPKMHKIC